MIRLNDWKSRFNRLTRGISRRGWMAAGGVALMIAALWLILGVGPAVYSERVEYDSDGRLESRITANGAEIGYRYDPAGRIAEIFYPNGQAVRYGYDGAGNTVWVQDQAGRTEYRHDEFNRLQETSTPRGQKISYEYDPWGRMIALSLSDGYRVEYDY